MTVQKVKVEARYWSIGQLHAAVYSIEKGMRPVAEITVPDSLVDECLDYIGEARLCYVPTSRGENQTAIYIYQDKSLKDIISFTLGRTFSKEILITWVEGKMFGYSNEEIGAFIKKNRE